jgi:putative ABC transport system substrate-binding protein
VAARGARAASSKGGCLGYLAPARLPNLIEALRAGLRDFGYVEGQNLAIEYRFALGQWRR